MSCLPILPLSPPLAFVLHSFSILSTIEAHFVSRKITVPPLFDDSMTHFFHLLQRSFTLFSNLFDVQVPHFSAISKHKIHIFRGHKLIHCTFSCFYPMMPLFTHTFLLPPTFYPHIFPDNVPWSGTPKHPSYASSTLGSLIHLQAHPGLQ